MAASTNGFIAAYENSVPCDEITIPVPWGLIKGRWWGSKSVQPVIAIHGWQDNSGSFDNLAPLLATDIPILCIDLPGHGFSSRYPNGQYYYIFWDGILILRRILKHYKWNKVKLMGHSLGGAISFLYAASYPDEVECYISIDIASPTVRDTKQLVSSVGDSVDRFLKYESLAVESLPCYGYDEMIEIAYEGYGGSVTRDSCKTLMKRGVHHMGDNRYSFTRDPRLKVPVLGFMAMEQVLEFSSRITCAVMNIRGNPGMKWINPKNYDLVLNKISETARYLERHIVPGTHHLHLNNADSVAEIIRHFLLANH